MTLLPACTTVSVPEPRREPPTQTRRMAPVSIAGSLIDNPRIRVGILTDQSTATFPRVEGGYYLQTDRESFVIRRGFRVEAPLAGAAAFHAVQVAAISDSGSAERLAERLRSEGVSPAMVVFDAGGGVYRVLAGRFAETSEAEVLRNRLVESGYGRDLLVTRRPSEEIFEQRLRVEDDEGIVSTIETGALLIIPVEGRPVRIGDGSYRGGARIFINNRGLINVINELNLEDYVRGVVPNEMGPSTYDELEALKAQALAARTYAVSRRGDYGREGYDLCATPACQVYRGLSSEHELSNRAVDETAGRIITHQGEPIDALYTSTCGGETSDVATMFPGRSDPYLKHVRCVELDVTPLAGRTEGPMLRPWEVHAEIFLAATGLSRNPNRWSATELSRAVAAAARLAGVPMSSEAVPASVRRGDVLDYLGRALRFSQWSETILLPEDIRYFFPSGSGAGAQQPAAFLNKFQIVPGQNIDGVDPSAPMPQDELYALLYSWLARQNALTENFGTIRGMSGRQITLKAQGQTRQFTLPEGIPLFRTLNDRLREYRSLPILMTDRATIVTDRSNRVIAMMAQANYDGAAFDRTSSFSSWIRSYRAGELIESIRRRNPVGSVVDLRPLRRDAAQRVAALEVVDAEGKTFVLEGLPIRWSLNLPDNLFVMQRSVDADGMPRFTFYGKGWGHGTGMCQVGAYGMAMRGATAEQIVRHYYTRVEVSPIRE